MFWKKPKKKKKWHYLVLFVNRTKSKTALIETALTGESLYKENESPKRKGK